MAKKEAEAQTQTEAEDRKSRLRQAYQKATTALRENHREEFNDLYSTAAADLDVEWSPRLTEQEKAERQFDQLLTDFPELRDRLQEA